ncbi:hypothetical protein A3Q56_02597, partial [Intoshia linei]
MIVIILVSKRVKCGLQHTQHGVYMNMKKYVHLNKHKRQSNTYNNNRLIVSTKSGRVRGIRQKLPWLNETIDIFLGIPYANPPTGSLRFHRPQPISSWTNILSANKMPNSCYQNMDNFFGDFEGSSMWNPNTKVSEDCLYLNIWTPYHTTLRRYRNLPVVIWIYGGGFYSGSTALNVYDSKILSTLNNIIVVTLNYRVNVFGFLSMDHEDAPGNVGMLDQLMALQWINDNIKVFGGDPNNITLMGESAGSVSVSLHLLSPLSQHLFNRAILQSGTANMNWATLSQQEAKQRTMELAINKIKCHKTNNLNNNTLSNIDTFDKMEIINCLIRTPAQELIDKMWITKGILQFPFVPVVDGYFLMDKPKNLVKKRQFKNCSILIGSNSNEASYFLIYELSNLLKLNTTSMNYRQFVESLKSLFNYHPKYPNEIKDYIFEAVKFQYTNWIDKNNKFANILNLDNAVSDAQFVCKVNDFADAYAQSGQNVYYYLFNHRSDNHHWPIWMGVLHGDEILYTFGEPFKMASNYTKKDRLFSRKIMKYWSNFVKTGNPNKSPGETSLKEWPIRTPHTRVYLELNFNSIIENKHVVVKKGPRISQCAFWEKYIPSIKLQI